MMKPLPHASPIGVTTSSRTTHGSNCSTTSATASTGSDPLVGVVPPPLAPADEDVPGSGLPTSGGLIFAELPEAFARSTLPLAGWASSDSAAAKLALEPGAPSAWTALDSEDLAALALAGLGFDFAGATAAAGPV